MTYFGPKLPQSYDLKRPSYPPPNLMNPCFAQNLIAAVGQLCKEMSPARSGDIIPHNLLSRNGTKSHWDPYSAGALMALGIHHVRRKNRLYLSCFTA